MRVETIERMRISFAALFAWLIPASLVVGALGAYPTWRVSGTPGLLAQLAAGAVVLVVMAASARFICHAASHGPRRAAQSFVAGFLVRVAACAALSAAVGHWLADLPQQTLLVWTGLFYLVMVLAEAIWLARAMQRDAHRVYLGEIRRSKTQNQ